MRMGIVQSRQFHKKAELLREASGSTNVKTTLLKAVKVLNRFGISHYVCGGFAVQERGWARFTDDVDIIVPDVQFALEVLALNGFRRMSRPANRVTYEGTKVGIDLLPGGGRVGPGPLTFPLPKKVSSTPQLLSLAELVSLKLSAHIGRGVHGTQDLADAVELIMANRPPRDFAVAPEVRDEFLRIWDGLRQEEGKEASRGARTSRY